MQGNDRKKHQQHLHQHSNDLFHSNFPGNGELKATAFYADLWPRRTVFRLLGGFPTSPNRPHLSVVALMKCSGMSPTALAQWFQRCIRTMAFQDR